MPDFGFDDWMDAELRNVPEPHDLHARLRSAKPTAEEQAGANAAERDSLDTRMDALLRNVEVPEGLHRRLRGIARRHVSWNSLSQRTWAAAASLLILVAGGAYLATVRVADGMADGSVAEKSLMPAGDTLLESPVETTPANTKERTSRKPRRQTPVTIPLGQPNLAEDESHRMLESVAGVSTSIRKAIDAKMRARFALGASGRIEPLPELEVLETPEAFGVTPPIARGYDMLFQLRHGEHPFVPTSADKRLTVSRMPFTFRTASYDQAISSVAAGRFPEREKVRVEDFLAAQQYLLPSPPPNGLALHAAGCLTPLSNQGTYLLQLMVQAAEGRRSNQRPTRMIAVVDTSSAMQVGARDKITVRALSKLAKYLGPQDKLTLIGFSEMPRVLLENAGHQELTVLGVSGGLEPTSGTANLLSAIQAAADAVAASPKTESLRVVFVAADDSLASTDHKTTRETLQRLSTARIPWHFVKLSSQTDLEPNWQQLATDANGRVSSVSSMNELHAACLETLTGRPAMVARAVSAKITFNAKAVASYRLLGHEAVTLTGNAGDPLTVNFHTDQNATCMYELQLRADGKGDLAVAELTWSDPNSGRVRRQVKQVRASDLTSSFDQAPAWLQQGVVAAKTAEFLRGSYYLSGTRRIGQLLELAETAQSDAAKSPDFRGLVRLIERADGLR